MKLGLLFLLPILMLALSCEQKHSSLLDPPKFDHEAAIVEIINETLPILLPDSVVKSFHSPQLANPSPSQLEFYRKQTNELNEYIKKYGITVFLDSTLLPLDYFIVSNPSSDRKMDSISKLKSPKLELNHFSFSAIKDYQNVKLISNKLITPPNPNNHFGNAYFSQMLFHSDNKKVIFIFGKRYFLSCLISTDEVIEVENKNGKWIITSNDVVTDWKSATTNPRQHVFKARQLIT